METDAAPPPVTQPGTLSAALRDAARRWPDRVAWTFDPPGDRFTFAAVHRLTDGYAQALRDRGVRAGDRVAVLLGNEAAFPLTWLALSLLGAAAVPVNTKYQPAEAEHVLRACAASAIVAGERFEPLLRRLPPDGPARRRLLPAAEIAASAEIAAAEMAAATAKAEATGPDVGDPDPAGTANIQFTSGTTGHPKGCVLPHNYWTVLAQSMV